MQERAIGTIESSFLLLHDHFGGSYTGAAAVKIGGAIDRDVASRSLRAVVARHPLLRARLVDHDGTPHLAVDASGDPVVRFDEWPAEEWHDVLKDAVAPFTDRGRPLWRSVFLSNAARDRHLLVVAAHHAIGDALSLTYLVKSFLVECARILRGDASAGEEQSPPLLPSIEYLADAAREVKRDWGQLLKIAGVHLGPSKFPYAQGAPRRPERTSMQSAILDEARVAGILAACRARKTPLTGLLAASLCEAVREVFGSGGDFLVACPMSCRPLSRKVRLDDAHFGCYTRVGYVHSADEPLWTRASRISQRLDVMSKEATFTKNVRFRGAQRVFRAAAKLPRFGFTDVAVSNLGIVDFAPAAFAPLSVDWLRLHANLDGAFEMFLLATCIFQKKMSVNLAFPEPHMTRAKAIETFRALDAIIAREERKSS